MSRMSKLRAGVVVVPLLAVLATGCSSEGGGSGDDELTVPTPTPTAEEVGDPSADEAALRALFVAYYEGLAEIENAEETDPAVLEGVVDGSVLEEQIGRIQQLKNAGLRMAGEPVISDVVIEGDADTSVVQGCVDQSARAFFDSEGEPVPVQDDGPEATAVAAERTADGWLITEDRGAEGATMTC